MVDQPGGRRSLRGAVSRRCVQGTAPDLDHAGSALRESGSQRRTDFSRAPDGTLASDLPLPAVRAHGGINRGSDSEPVDTPLNEGPSRQRTGVRRGGTAPPASGRSVSLGLLLAMTMFMALLSGVGAVPYLFTGKLEPYWAGIANAVGCGVMLAASFDLLEESKSYSAAAVLVGIVLGVVAMAVSQKWLDQFEDVSFSDLQVTFTPTQLQPSSHSHSRLGPEPPSPRTPPPQGSPCQRLGSTPTLCPGPSHRLRPRLLPRAAVP